MKTSRHVLSGNHVSSTCKIKLDDIRSPFLTWTDVKSFSSFFFILLSIFITSAEFLGLPHLSQFKIPWHFPDREKILFFPDFSMICGNPDFKCEHTSASVSLCELNFLFKKHNTQVETAAVQK